MLLRPSLFAVTWSLLFALCLGQQQYVYFSATGTQDWQDVATLSECDATNPCTLSTGTETLSESTVVVIEPGSFHDSIGNAVFVVLSLAGSGVQVTFQYPSGVLPSFGNAISGLNLQVTGSDVSQSAITLSSISFSSSILSFGSVGQFMANTTYLNKTTVTIARCSKTIILDSQWISLESSLLTLVAYNDLSTYLVGANSLNISNLVATCSSTAPCRHFASIYATDEATDISIYVTGSSFSGMAGFTYLPSGTSSYAIATAYQIYQTSITVPALGTFDPLSYSAYNAVIAAVWPSTPGSSSGASPSFVIQSSNITVTGEGTMALTPALSLAPMTITASQLKHVSLTTTAGFHVSQQSILTNCLIILNQVTDALCADSTFHTSSITASTPKFGFLLYSTSIYIQSCAFTEDEDVSFENAGGWPTLLLSASTLMDTLNSASSPNVSIRRLGITASSTVAGSLEVTKELTSLNVSGSSPVTASSDIVLQFSPISSKPTILIADSVLITNIVLQTPFTLHFRLGLSSSTVGAVVSTVSTTLWPTPGPTVIFTWNPASFSPSPDGSPYNFLRPVQGLTPAPFPVFTTLPSWSALGSQSGYNFSTAYGTTEYGTSNYAVAYRATITPVTSPTSVVCPGNRPSSSFFCGSDGVWTSNSSVIITGPTVIFSSPSTVQGNFSVTSIEIVGLGSTIGVSECASMPESVTLILTPQDLEELKKLKGSTTTLITAACTNASEGDSVTINVETQGKKRSCDKITGTLKSQGNNMVSILSIESSGCNRWWIILVAVVGGIVLIAAVLAIVFTTVPAARNCIRPYARRNELKEAGSVK